MLPLDITDPGAPQDGTHSLAYRQATADDPAPSRATPADAFAAAREVFRRGEKLDMVALAAEVGVARATLYRWTGGREQLLADLMWAELQLLVDAITAAARGRGLPRLTWMVGVVLDALADAPSLRGVLRAEGDAGLRMIISPTGPIRPRLLHVLTDLIRAEVEAGHYRAPADPAVLADGVIALAERYLHNGGDPALNPDPATARTVAALLLREPCA